MASPICVIGSGGVNIAATVKIITITYLLLLFRYSEFTTPILANKFNKWVIENLYQRQKLISLLKINTH